MGGGGGGVCSIANYIAYLFKKSKRKIQGSATITNRSPSQTPRGRENRQIQTSTNRTNVRKVLILALSSPSEVIAMLKGLKNKSPIFVPLCVFVPNHNLLEFYQDIKKKERIVKHRSPRPSTDDTVDNVIRLFDL